MDAWDCGLSPPHAIENGFHHVQERESVSHAKSDHHVCKQMCSIQLAAYQPVLSTGCAFAQLKAPFKYTLASKDVDLQRAGEGNQALPAAYGSHMHSRVMQGLVYRTSLNEPAKIAAQIHDEASCAPGLQGCQSLLCTPGCAVPKGLDMDVAHRAPINPATCPNHHT